MAPIVDTLRQWFSPFPGPKEGFAPRTQNPRDFCFRYLLGCPIHGKHDIRQIVTEVNLVEGSLLHPNTVTIEALVIGCSPGSLYLLVTFKLRVDQQVRLSG
jgi:hypothetical protein